MSEKITFEQLEAKVREIAAERPTFAYEVPPGDKCRYVHKKEGGGFEPGCLFGQALIQLGVKAEDLNRIDESNFCGIREAIRELNIDARPLEVRWAELAQGEQDSGCSWHAAVKHADMYTRRADH